MPARSAGSERNARAPTGHDERQGWSASSARSSRRGPTPIPAPRSASGGLDARPQPILPLPQRPRPWRRQADKLHGSAGARGMADGEDRRLRSRPQARRVGFSKFGRGGRDSPGGHRKERRPLHSIPCRRARSLPRRGVIARAAAGGTTRGSSGRACPRPGGSSRAATAAASRSKLQPLFWRPRPARRRS